MQAEIQVIMKYAGLLASGVCKQNVIKQAPDQLDQALVFIRFVLYQFAGDEGAAALADLLADLDLERLRSEQIEDVSKFLTEEAAVGGVVLAVRGDHAGDRLFLSFAVRVRVDHDLQRIKDRAVLNIFERDGAAASVDIHAALVKVFAALKFDFHSSSFPYHGRS